MKVREEQDIYDKSCLVFPKSASIEDIHEWLEAHYHGYQFAIVLDETKDEFQVMDETVVNFFSDLADEAIEAGGDYHAVSNRDYTRLMKYLQDHGTSWAEVTR